MAAAAAAALFCLLLLLSVSLTGQALRKLINKGRSSGLALCTHVCLSVLLFISSKAKLPAPAQKKSSEKITCVCVQVAKY
jgi:hypothetical protein